MICAIHNKATSMPAAPDFIAVILFIRTYPALLAANDQTIGIGRLRQLLPLPIDPDKTAETACNFDNAT